MPIVRGEGEIKVYEVIRMVMEKKKKKWLVPVYVVVGLAVFLLFLTKGIGQLELDVSSKGHGDISSGSLRNLGISLGIVEDFDYVDDVTGETFCFDDECWIEAELAYENCMVDVGLEFSSVNYDLGWFEIVPAVAAIHHDYDPMVDLCEVAYENTLMTECSRRCEIEVYVWDGYPVTNLGLFSEEAFPNFIHDSELSCESWFIGGTWVSEVEKVGCIDAMWLSCDSESVLSAQSVCEEIGKSWVCSSNEIYCWW